MAKHGVRLNKSVGNFETISLPPPKKKVQEGNAPNSKEEEFVFFWGVLFAVVTSGDAKTKEDYSGVGTWWTHSKVPGTRYVFLSKRNRNRKSIIILLFLFVVE